MAVYCMRKAAVLRVITVIFSFVAVFVLTSSASASAGCVWKPVDAERVRPAAGEWFRLVSASDRQARWSISAGDRQVTLEVVDGVNVADVIVTLADDCRRTVETNWRSGRSGWFSHSDATRLVDSLNLSYAEVADSGAGARQASVAAGSPGRSTDPADLVLLLISLAFVAVAFVRPAQNTRSWIIDAAFMLVILFLAARPLFSIPFSTDAQILRVAYAARNMFADWNHPFLSYLLNRPAALLSNDPRVLRIMPFAYVVIEAFLFSLAARRIGGRGASALVSVWMAVSVRLTMGMVDLSDWNLAGVFLAGMVLWVLDSFGRGRRLKWVPVPALLILGGCFSSFLMIVPAAILLAFVVYERIAGRLHWYQAATTAIALIAAAAYVMDAFSVGVMGPRHEFTSDLSGTIRSIFTSEPPFGLTIAMPFLIVGGFFTRRFGDHPKTRAFCLATFVVSLVAISVALLFSLVNGAYYFGLYKGICYLSAAVLVASLIPWAGRRLAGAGLPGWFAAGLVPAVLALAVGLATFRIDNVSRLTEVGGLERMGEFVELTGRGAVRVISNDENADVLMEYQDSLAGRMDIGVMTREHPSTWVQRTLTRLGVDAVDCASLPGRYLLLWANSGRRSNRTDCEPLRVSDCVEILSGPGSKPCAESDRAFCYYDCRKTVAGNR